MITKRFLLAATTAALVTPFINTDASANIRWQMAVAVPDTSFTGRVAQSFVEEVRTATNNALTINVHYRSSLVPEGQVLRGVRTGQIQAGMFLGSLHGNDDPFFEVEGIPFLANSWSETRALRAAAEPFVRERLEQRGATELFSVNWPSQGIYSQTPINSIADLRGLRLRVYNRITVRMGDLAGARSVNICCNPADTALAFASGMAEAMFTSGQSGVDTQIWDYAKYFTDVGGMRNRSIAVASTAAFNRLPNDIKAVVTKAVENANARGFEESRKVEVDAVEVLRRRGMTVYPASDRLMDDLRGIGTQLAGEWVSAAGPQGGALMARYRELARNNT